ncbi:MAG: hypothetical protein WBK15_02155 [Yoonia sp.]
MQQIVVHAGFHKTGTTTIQSFLMENGKHLWPHMALVMPARISEVTKFATMHSVIGGPISRDEFHFRMVEFLRSLDIGKKRHLCISAEDLAGLIPGRSGKETYAGCPALMATTRDALREVFGPDLPITFYLSTRDPDRWLRSSYWQNLRSAPLKMDYATFAETYPDAANFEPIIAQTREALGDTPLLTTAMEDTLSMRFGPATPIIGLFALPAETLDALTMPISRNASPSPEIIAEVLALNRSGLDRDTLDARKKALLG